MVSAKENASSKKDLVVYNTLTKKKEVFSTLNPDKVKMYVCGPTVYGLLHVGNFRGAIFFNLVRHWLESKGLKVTYVYNYTDVDDKIINKAKEEAVESTVISERFIAEFEKDFARLGLQKHDYNPRVTEYMTAIIKFVGDLVKNKSAYEVEGEVFFDVAAFPDYGKLSGKKLDELDLGHRIAVDDKKRGPHDFVLWKPSKPGEPYWDSPWGKGRPGWHIECSAMIHEILGPTIDIHGGGIDLIFPHHENEIAQGEGRTGKGSKYCNHWMHNNFININDEKMSKSLGNIVTGRQFMDDYHPEILKYLILSSHYRAQLNFNEEKILQTIAGLARIYNALRDAETVLLSVGASREELKKKAPSNFSEALKAASDKISQAMDDDFNTVEMLAQIFEIVRVFNALTPVKKAKDATIQGASALFLDWTLHYGKMAALFLEPSKDFLRFLDVLLIKKKNIDASLVDSLITERKEARANKDWKRSDEVRDQLVKMEIIVLDHPDGTTTWEVKKG